MSREDQIKQVWEFENNLADCYPLPSYDANLPIPLYDPVGVKIPHHANKASLVSDEDFPFWLTEWAQADSLDILLRSTDPSDLARLYVLLEKTHAHIHALIKRASEDPGTVVIGTYLSFTLMHAGVEKLMQNTLAKIKKARGLI